MAVVVVIFEIGEISAGSEVNQANDEYPNNSSGVRSSIAARPSDGLIAATAGPALQAPAPPTSLELPDV
jgi:hypothetical protein